MKRLMCILLACLLMAAGAFAEEGIRADQKGFDLNLETCRIDTQQSGAVVSFNGSVQVPDDAAEPCFMDVGRVAVSAGAIADWQFVLNPMKETGLKMILLGMTGENVGSGATLKLEGEIAYPLQILFPVDFYKAVTKASNLDLRQQVWRMVRSESDKQIVVAKPDLPHLNNNSDIPKVLEDFDALVHRGNSWENQIDYVRQYARLRQIVTKTYNIARLMETYEVTITFESADKPGTVQITKA